MVNFYSILLVIISSFLGAVATIIIKRGTNKYNLKKLFFTSYFYWGFFFYGISTVFYILALNFEKLSIVYPLVSITYLWTTFFSVKYLKEEMNLWKYVGLSGIILGIIFISIGS
jgi:uncharacterized membrane protein